MKEKRKWQYKVTQPMLQHHKSGRGPVMDFPEMTAWLDDMDKQGWEFVSYGATIWNGGYTQQWWIFRKPA